MYPDYHTDQIKEHGRGRYYSGPMRQYGSGFGAAAAIAMLVKNVLLPLVKKQGVFPAVNQK